MTNNLKCEKDYEEWQVSMYANFGLKWVCMNRGPAWEFDIEETVTDRSEGKFLNTVSQGTASNYDKFSNNEIRTVNSDSDFPYPLDVVLSLPEASYLSTNAEGNPVSPSGAGNANTSVDLLAKALELSGIEEEETLDTSLPAIEQDTQALTSDSCVSGLHCKIFLTGHDQ